MLMRKVSFEMLKMCG